MNTFQAVSWHANDHEGAYRISIFGRKEDGSSICLHTNFKPFFFVELGNGVSSDLVSDTLHSRVGNDLVSCSVVKRKKFYGFTNGQHFQFAKVVFKTHRAFKMALSKLRYPIDTGRGRRRVELYEANFDPMLRFCHIQNIRPAGWVTVDTNECQECEPTTYVDIELSAYSWKSVVGSSKESVAPLVQASFDIETYSHDGGFPDPLDKQCPCIQIATTLQKYGEPEPYKRHLLSFGSCDAIEGVDVVECSTERRLLERWTELVRDEGVDILIGYNIWGFDLNYMWQRAKITNAFGFFELGRFHDKDSDCKAAAFSSGAYGDSDYMMVDTIGRFQLDLLVVMKREHKLSSYSLNAVAKHFLNDAKVDMPYKEMFRKYKGCSADRKEIGVYCVKDTDIPLALVNKLAIVPNMVEMAKATWVPLSFLIERGQGIKVFSQILQKTREENMVVVTLNKDWRCNECKKFNNSFAKECKHCGVAKPAEAAYEGATVLHAKSGAYTDTPITGLDFASLYPTIMRAHNLCHSTIILDEKYAGLDGVEYMTKDGHTFVQNVEGILPKMLRELATNRKQAKKAMASATDSFMQSVYNGKQLAFKVSMNSIYGFCGALVGMLPCKPVASCTTSIGREMILQTKTLVEQWYPGADVVYGDSVTADTPVLVKYDDTHEVKYVSIDMVQPSVQCDGTNKGYAPVSGISVWSDLGWTKIHSIMKHKLDPVKGLYRVHTTSGFVDVTGDHSLITRSGREVKPTELHADSCLLTAFPEAKDGSRQLLCGAYSVNDSVTTGNKVFAAKMFGAKRAAGVKPLVMLDSTGRIHISANLTREKLKWLDPHKICDGFVVHVEQLPAPRDSYVYDLTTENHHFHAGVGNIIVHNTDSVMVKFDTGSKGKDALEKSFELGVEAAERISATFKQPIELEFEKVYMPYLLFSKKRYAGLMYTDPKKPDYIDAKGIQLVRRDNPPFVKEVSKKVLDTIMYKLDIDLAANIAREAAAQLLRYEVPIDQLVISKSLKRIGYVPDINDVPEEKRKTCIKCNGFYLTHEYSNANQPHITVARKREERETGTGPRSGDRVPYVFVETKNPRDLQFMKAEDPDYAKANDIKLDVGYYLDHSLQSPLTSLFSLFMDDPAAELFGKSQLEFTIRKNRQVDIYKFLGI